MRGVDAAVPPGSRIFHAYMRIVDELTRACVFLSALVLFCLLLCYLYEVPMRYFFNSPTMWTYDVSTWLLGLSITLALPEIGRSRGHIAITFILENLPKSTRQALTRAISFAAFAVCLATAVICFRETLRQHSQGIETLWNYPVPKWWISSSIPIGFGLTALHFLNFALIPTGKDDAW